MVSTRTTTGSIGIKARHAPLMAILEPTELRLYKSDSDVVRFAQGEGYLQVADNRALVLVEEAITPDDIDRSAFDLRRELGIMTDDPALVGRLKQTFDYDWNLSHHYDTPDPLHSAHHHEDDFPHDEDLVHE